MTPRPFVLAALLYLAAGTGDAGPAPAAAAPPAPCSAAENRQFDFWLGAWEVRVPAGGLAGHSEVSAILGGCVIFERWQDQQLEGQSFNTYDPETGTWRQHWVDSAGRSSDLRGGIVDGRMVLQSGVQQGPAGPRLTRITWEVQGTDQVRQHVEQSRDDGRTWATVFDGRYSRRKAV